MATRSTVVTVPATAGGILLCDGTSGTAAVPVSVVFFVPAAGQTVFMGGDDVTAANGFPIAPGAYSPSFDLIADKVFVIVAAGTQAINVLRLRV